MVRRATSSGPTGYLDAARAQRLGEADPGVRRRGDARRARLPRPTWSRNLDEAGSRCSASTPKAATASTSSTSSTGPRSTWPTSSRSSGWSRSRSRRSTGWSRRSCPSRTPRRGGAAHHFNMSLAELDDRREPVPRPRRRPRPGLEQDRLRVRRRASCATRPALVGDLRRRPSTPTSGSPSGSPTARNSWAPVWATYGDNNRSCMLRLPRNRPCVENRGVDSAANPYLAAAFLLAAGLEGVARAARSRRPRRGPHLRLVDAPAGTADRLPRTLLEAVDAFEADPLVAEVFPAQFVTEYAAMKRAEWDEFHAPGHRLGAGQVPAHVLGVRSRRCRALRCPFEEIHCCPGDSVTSDRSR